MSVLLVLCGVNSCEWRGDWGGGGGVGRNWRGDWGVCRGKKYILFIGIEVGERRGRQGEGRVVGFAGAGGVEAGQSHLDLDREIVGNLSGGTR